jgi:hypothetical protein
MTRTFEEIGLEVDIENVATEAFNGIIERKDVDTFSVFDIETLVDVDEIGEFYAEVIASDLVHLNPTLLDVIGAQTDEDSVSSLLSTDIANYRQKDRR